MNTKALVKISSHRINTFRSAQTVTVRRPRAFSSTGEGSRHVLLPAQTNYELLRANNKLHRRVAQLEAALTESSRQLYETIVKLEGFSHSISHDMRTPLRTILGFAELLLNQDVARTDVATAVYLKKINGAAARMDEMIQEVCTYTRTVRTVLNIEPINLTLMAGQILNTFPQLQAQNPVAGNPHAFVRGGRA